MGCHFLTLGIFPTQGFNVSSPVFPALQVDSFPTEPVSNLTHNILVKAFLVPSVQFSPVTQSCPTLCDPMDHSTPGLPIYHQLTEFTQTHVHRVGDAINNLILCHSVLLLPSIFPSIRAFSDESVLHIRWPKYWSFNFSISPSSEYSGLISLRIDWLDLVVQGSLKSLLQHHSSKASILWHSAFFTVQLSHPYMTTGKTIVLTRQTFSRQSNVSAFEYAF